MDKHHTWHNGSLWHKDWPHQICIGQWPLFHGPVILCNILKTIRWSNVILGIMDQCDTKIDLLKYLWVNDLYFMVQWFCLIQCIFIKYLMDDVICGIMDQCDTKINLIKYILVSDLYFLVRWFCLIFWRLWWMNVIFGIIDQCDTKIDIIMYM